MEQFPAGSETRKSAESFSKAEIWTAQDDFLAKITDLNTAVAALVPASATEAAGLKAGMGGLGGGLPQGLPRAGKLISPAGLAHFVGPAQPTPPRFAPFGQCVSSARRELTECKPFRPDFLRGVATPEDNR
jgi:hypothetical protein